MKDSREDRDGGWRIEAPLIGSITISRKIVLSGLVVGMVLFTACIEEDCFAGGPDSPAAVEASKQQVLIESASRDMAEDYLKGISPEEARESAIRKYGSDAVNEAIRRSKPPDEKAPPREDTAPKAGAPPAGAASPDVKFYSELPPDDAAVTVTHGPLLPGWAPNAEIQKAIRVPENPLLFLSKSRVLTDQTTSKSVGLVAWFTVIATRGSEADFRQGQVKVFEGVQPGSVNATQLGPYRALLMQYSTGLRRQDYYVPLAEGMSALIAFASPAGPDYSPELTAAADALLNEAQSIAQGLRFQVNGKPVP